MFFFNDTATTEIYTLSLHDALPICDGLPYQVLGGHRRLTPLSTARRREQRDRLLPAEIQACERSEEHTSELQSRQYLVCRLLLEKKKFYYASYFLSHINISTSTSFH